MVAFKPYNKSDLLNEIEKISIKKENNNVVTYYGSRVINITKVSNRYEIFDIVKYLKDKIELIETNFQISYYSFNITRGTQYLVLMSDKIEIGGVKFYKSFYILNSTDKSRRLHFSAGLHSDKFYTIGANNIGLNKLHLKGVTKAAEDASVGLNGETFEEQIKSIESLLGHKVLFSKIREIILGDKKEIPNINHRKFDAFKNSLKYSALDGNVKLSNDEINQLSVESSKLQIVNDFYIDAFYVFQLYMRIFNRQDAHIIKNETSRILNITQWSVRNSILQKLGI